MTVSRSQPVCEAPREAGGSAVARLPTPPQTVSQRVRMLQAEARSLAKAHVNVLCQSLAEVEQVAAEIAEGGDAYAPGIRDLCRRIVEDAELRAQTLEAISARTM